MFRVGGAVVPKNSSLPEVMVHEYVENASDASKTSPTICLNLPLLIGHLRLKGRSLCVSARARGNPQEETNGSLPQKGQKAHSEFEPVLGYLHLCFFDCVAEPVANGQHFGQQLWMVDEVLIELA